MRDVAFFLCLGAVALLLSPLVDPKTWRRRLVVLGAIMLGLASAAALLPDSFRTAVRYYLSPGGIMAVVTIALVINVSLLCVALYRIAKYFPELSPRLMIMVTFLLFSYLFVLAMSYWTLSGEGSNCMSKPPLSKVDAVYFTLTALTTTGFGDLTPVDQVCRALVSEQLFIGYTVLTFLLAVVVGRAAGALPARK